jgi:hypothetical protein
MEIEMEQLLALQQTTNDIEQRLNELLGQFADNQGIKQNYFDIFNHDLGVINHLLSHPPSESSYYQKACESQEEYNEAMDLAKKRWEKGNKEFDVGKVIVKDLSIRKKQYQEAVDNLATYEQKQKDIESFSNYQEPQKGALKLGSPWWQLQTLADEQDQADLNDIVERLKTIAAKLDTKDKGEREVLFEQVTAMHTFDKKDDYKAWLLERASMLDKKDNKKRVPMLNELFPLFAGRNERLKKLRSDWLAQGVLAKASTDDLIKIIDVIDNFVALMDMIEKPLTSKSVDLKIKAQLTANRSIIDLFKQQVEAAAIWRIKGAAQYGNLRLDDALFVLRREFSQTVFQFDDASVLNRFSDIASMSVDSISYGCSLQNFKELHKLLQRSKNIKVQDQWLNSRWATNSDNRNLIEVSVQGSAIIPKVIAPFVPNKPHYFPPGAWIRYWFFRTNELLTGFWGWVRKIWVGTSNEAVTLINETYRHVDSFEKTVRENSAQGKGLNLLFLGQSASFLDALEIIPILAAEKERTKEMVTKGILGAILRWMPFFNVKLTSEFSSTWLKELDRAELAIKEKATKIANYIMEDFEGMLLDSIEKKSFLLPANIMNNVEKYIQHYGNKADLLRLQQIASPLYVIRKFNFLTPPKSDNLFRKIDDDNVTAFLRYAEKYWQTEQVSAVKVIVGIITRDNMPKNAAEDEIVFEKIKCLITEQDKRKVFSEVMTRIAKDFIFTTGDDGSDDCLHFLDRFASAAARTWRTHRSDNLDEKFTFINNILIQEPSHEKDLTSNEVQALGATQFNYSSYERYIKDIALAEREGKARRMLLLKQQATAYVKKYTGDNVLYADLMFALSSEGLEPFVMDYCEKRFMWLIEQDNHDNSFEFNEADERFITSVKNHPNIIARLVTLIKERTDGADDQLSKWVLNFNAPSLTAAYFGKRFEKLSNANKFQDILQDGDFYEQLLANPLFAKVVYETFGAKLNTFANEEDWDRLCADPFFRVIEKIGTLQNKETHRLLTIKYLLKMNNSDLTEKYITKLAEHVGAANLDKITTLPKAKQLMVDIVSDHLRKLGLNVWQGHAQYFIEFFLPLENKTLRQDIHLKWLTEFIQQPQRFSGEAFVDRSNLDGKFHFQNRQVPSDTVNLTDFYGQDNISQVRKLIMARLDNFSVNLDDDVIQLINGYFRDPVFNLQEDWPLYRKKRDLLAQAQKTIHCLRNGFYNDGMALLEGFYVQMMGTQALATVDSENFAPQIVQYQQQLFKQILSVVQESCKELFINPVLLETNEIDDKIEDLAVEKQQRTFMDLLSKANLPESFKQELKEHYQNRSLCLLKLKEFTANLNFEKMHLISFDTDDLTLFSKTLSKKAKRNLKFQVNTLKDYLQPDDPLIKALGSWLRLLRNDYSVQTAKAADVAELSQYRATVKNYPKMAEDMAARLVAALDAHEELTYFPLFKETRVAYQSMQYLSAASQRQLFTSVKLKIEWLLVQSDPVNAQFSRVDWSYHQKLLEGMLMASSPNPFISQITTGITLWVNSCLMDVEKQLKTLLDELDTRVQSKNAASQFLDPMVKKNNQLSILEKEHQLLKSALFARIFGSKAQTEKLDQLLNEVSRRQHLAMMKGASGMLVEHSLDFADKLLSTAGSDSQREQCIEIAQKWNINRSQPAQTALQAIRKVAVNDALPGFIGAFDKGIYEYFVKKHNLPTDFHTLMLEKMKEWDLGDALLEPERILKKHPLSEFLGILTPLAAKSSHGLLYSKPSMSDAVKLFVGFCLSIEAHQLVKLWQNRQAVNNAFDVSFKPGDISGPLDKLVKQLVKKYDIGWGEFNKGLFKAIAKDGEYFASWSATTISVEQGANLVERKVQLR